MTKIDFPWNAPELDQDLPPMDETNKETLQRDAEVLDWFIQNRGHRTYYKNAPVTRWIKLLRGSLYGWTQDSTTEGARKIARTATSSSEWLPVMCDIYLARLAAFCVLCVEGAKKNGALENLKIDASFVGAELGRRDDTQQNRFAIPGGVGTLLVAKYCAQAGGRSLQIFGDKSESLDISWQYCDNALLWFEAKSRSLAAGFASTSARKIVADVMNRIVLAAPKLRKRAKSERVKCFQSVVVTGFFPSRYIKELESFNWDYELRRSLQTIGPYKGPHAVILNLFGLDIVGKAVDPRTVRRSIEIIDSKPRPCIAARDAFMQFAGGKLEGTIVD